MKETNDNSKPNSKVKVKICCIKSKEEANLAIGCGAFAIGLVGQMPSGPGIIDDKLGQEIAQCIDKDISSFLLTSKIKSIDIIAHYNLVKTSTIQIVDEVEVSVYEEIRMALPNINLVQVIHVMDDTAITQALKVAEFVDYILLDSGNPNLKIKELGGTGKVHNWQISKVIRETVDVPVFLAGGLNSQNVSSATDIVKPYGVDVCSGVRINGRLDRRKIEDFFKALS